MSNSETVQEKVYRRLPELKELERVIERLGDRAQVEVLEKIHYHDKEFPIYSVTLGSQDLSHPCLLVVGGVHGLERIGTQVINSVLGAIAGGLEWDEFLQEQLRHCRLIFVPLINPVGMYRMSRSNGNNVDLMRNSPIESDEPTQFMYAGQRLSPALPFYRGRADKMEKENLVLWKLVQEKVFPAKVSIALDCHSGFGYRDRLWFPYAKTRKPFEKLAEVHALKEMFDMSYPHHVYTIEPQAQQYTTHGDVWDYFLDQHKQEKKSGLFLPLCLEMGSWLWIRKNPFQLFNPLGVFNPLTPHREKRMLRRHKNLIDFLRRAVVSSKKWVELNEEQRKVHEQAALELWYKDQKK